MYFFGGKTLITPTVASQVDDAAMFRPRSASLPVGVDTPAAPANIALPVVPSTITVGVAVTALAGEWLGDLTSLERIWLRDGQEINGATALTYMPTSDDEGHDLALQETAETDGGSATVVSIASNPVQAAVSGPTAAEITALYEQGFL